MASEKRATYTTIVHRTLEDSGLSVLEFFVADVIDKLSKPYCTMRREKMAEMISVSKRSLQRIIKKLEEEKYIEVNQRGVRSTDKWVDLIDIEGVTKLHPRGDKLAPHGVTNLPPSIVIYKDISESEASQENANPLPPYFGQTSLQRIVTAYSILWWDTYQTPYKANFGMIGKLYKPLLAELSEMQIAALFIIHFSWHGANGDDERAFRNLDSAMFPIQWVPSKVNEYTTYLKNVAMVNFEALEAIKTYVRQEMSDALKRAVKDGIIKLPEKQ